MKGKHSLRLLAIYSLSEQNQRTKTRSRRGKKNRGLLLTLERKSITPEKGLSYTVVIHLMLSTLWHMKFLYSSFVVHLVNKFLCLPKPNLDFFLIHNQFLSWLTPLRQLFVVCADHRPRYWVGRQLLYLKLTIGPLALKYKSYLPVMFREDLSSLYWVPVACLYCPPPALNGHAKPNLTNKT